MNSETSGGIPGDDGTNVNSTGTVTVNSTANSKTVRNCTDRAGTDSGEAPVTAGDGPA